MFGSDRSWDSDWCGIAPGRGRREGFKDDSREGGDLTGELMGELKEPVFEKSVAYRSHRQEAREGSPGGVSGHGGARASDNRKKDARSTSKKPVTAGGNEDVDAVWHRGSGPRNF
jgi:hypothetical protein